ARPLVAGAGRPRLPRRLPRRACGRRARPLLARRARARGQAPPRRSRAARALERVDRRRPRAARLRQVSDVGARASVEAGRNGRDPLPEGGAGLRWRHPEEPVTEVRVPTPDRMLRLRLQSVVLLAIVLPLLLFQLVQENRRAGRLVGITFGEGGSGIP